MAIHLVGGSNSRMKEGWSRYLADILDEPMHNRSIGATSSIMGAVLLDVLDDIKSGDTLIWEYALNDSGHVRRGYPCETLLRFIEYTLRECARRGIRFTAAIFTPKFHNKTPDAITLRTRALALFASYGVDAFDVNECYCTRNNLQEFPDELYSNPLHYVENDDLMGFIAQGVAALLPGKVPTDLEPIHVGSGEYRIERFQKDEVFKNSIISLPVAKAPTHMAFTHAEGWNVLGLLVLTHPRGGAIEFTCGDSRLELSLTHAAKKFDKHLLKFISFERLLGAPVACAPNASVTITPITKPGTFLSEIGLRSDLGLPALDAHNGLIAGMILERRD
jgi:sulfur relay (sulfurtransferase) DsrF/TusC family protein